MTMGPIADALACYEARYETKWKDAPPHCQKIWLDAWGKAMERAINVIEAYRVSVGNSASGEMAAEWTMENLREIRDELREMVPNAKVTGSTALSASPCGLPGYAAGENGERK